MNSVSGLCGWVNRRDHTHGGATLPFPGVGQIKRRSWGFSLAPTGPSGEGSGQHCGLGCHHNESFIFQLMLCVTPCILTGLGEGLLQSSKTSRAGERRGQSGWAKCRGGWNTAGPVATRQLKSKIQVSPLLTRTAGGCLCCTAGSWRGLTR